MVLSMGNFLGILTCLILLLNIFAVIGGVGGEGSDILCLRSIKESFQDPFGHLSSWDFSNSTPGIICRFTGIDCWHEDEDNILAIELVDMGLRGQFPPGLEHCTSLVTLNLSRNNLSGSIPEDISLKLSYVIVLDLSFNQFSGTIPPDIARCQFLNALYLNNNQLWGQIPSQFGGLLRLKAFDVSHNGLTGPLPIFLKTDFPADSFRYNPGLCGNPLNPCDVDPFVEVFFKGIGIGWVFSFTLVTVLCSFFGIPMMPMLISSCRRKKKQTRRVKEDLK